MKKSSTNSFRSQRETTANFCNFPDTTKISAASINNPIIANITAHRATAVGGGGSDGGGRAIGEQRGGVGVVKMDEGGKMRRLAKQRSVATTLT